MRSRTSTLPLHKLDKERNLLRMSKLPLRRRAGFSLVEIMVGLVIGMLAIIVMLQVFALSEGRKRTTTGGGDAQSNGAIMLYRLQHDISQAGYGLTSIRLFNCSATWAVASGATIATAVPLAPVTINPPVAIIPAGDTNTDTLLLVYGNGNGQPEGNIISAQAGSTVYTVQMPSSFTAGAAGAGDRVIAAPSPCGTLNLDRIAAVGANNVTVVAGTVGATDSPLYNLGPRPVVLAYAIRGGSLTVCDYMLNDCGTANTANSSIWVPIGSNIVSMRAVYGRDDVAAGSPVSTTVIQNANVNIWDKTQPTTACLWTRVAAISLVLVARSSQFEKELVTTTAINVGLPVNAPTWAQNSVAPIVAAGNLPPLGPDTAIDEPWKHYRYKVFQTVAPIRNVAWMGVPIGC